MTVERNQFVSNAFRTSADIFSHTLFFISDTYTCSNIVRSSRSRRNRKQDKQKWIESIDETSRSRDRNKGSIKTLSSEGMEEIDYEIISTV